MINTQTKDKHFPLKVFPRRGTFSERDFFPHRHKEFEIALFKSGGGTYKTLKTEYDIRGGDIFLFGTDEVHCITKTDGNMPFVNIQFEPRLIWSGAGDMLDAKYLQIFLNRDKPHSNRLDRGNPRIGEIRSLILEMEEEFAVRREDYELMAKAQLLTLLVKIRRYFFDLEGDGFYTRQKSFAPVAEAMDYIDANFAGPLSLEKIASVAKMSPNYFCAVFKKLNGLTAWDYITIKRVEAAKAVLKSSPEATVLSAALQCGFSSTAGFNRAFKRCTGVTPSDFLKNG